MYVSYTHIRRKIRQQNIVNTVFLPNAIYDTLTIFFVFFNYTLLYLDITFYIIGTQVAAKHMPLSSILIAVDLVKMKPVGGAIRIVGDITTQKCKFEIQKNVGDWPVDAVLCDGAPNISGAWDKDAYVQCEIALASLKLATRFLRQG